MSKTATLYDKTGAAFKLDHENDGKLYVRPLVKVIIQTNYGESYHEEEDFEPAEYLVSKAEDELFYAPPVEALDADIVAKKAELAEIKAQYSKEVSTLRGEKQKAEWELSSAKHQLEEWMKTHKGMIDLGKLLDGKVLYPVSVEENRYDGGYEIPHIPKMKEISGLRVESGDFEKGKEWRVKRYLSDSYHTSFQFFDTEEERDAAISSAFEATCTKFRSRPDFKTEGYSSNLTYGRLLKWVEAHPALSIPDDIKEMKSANDVALVEQRKAKLAAELAAMSGEVTA